MWLEFNFLSKLCYVDFDMIKIMPVNRASNTGQSDIWFHAKRYLVKFYNLAIYEPWWELLQALVIMQSWGSEFLSYKFDWRNRVTQNGVILRVINSKIFIEILLSSY